MSVSLDTDRAKWLAAIKQDNLTWPNHVSDLKGWSSQVGRLYEVGSVPFTVLIDKEGRIIKVNLRGESLEKELEMIRKALQISKGRRKKAAEALGISERTLYRKIKQYELE
jgi:DNA-binding NtrC family response regulator